MENTRLVRSAFKVGSFTLLSRFLGLIRDILTASVFGTSSAMSDFVVAFRIPNMFRALFGEGALSSAFVPVFMKTRADSGEPAAWTMARKVVTVVGVGLAAMVAAGIGLAYALEYAAPNLIEHAPQVLPLARIMFPYMLFICLAALSQAILNSYHRFSLPAFTPSLLNITWILFVLLVCPRMGPGPAEQIFGVAWGVFAAGLVQLIAQLPTMIHLGYRPGISWDTKDERVRRVFTLMGPTALGSSVTQVNVMINGLLARWAADWAPAALFFAERLLYFPQGILATAMSTVLLPVFSGHAARNDQEQMRATLNHALRTLLFVMAPAAVGLLVLAGPITQMLFASGRFNQESVSHTAIALQFYAPGLFVFCLAKVFVPAFYALHNTKTPFRIGLVSVGLNFCMNWFFILTWPTDLKHAGLALSTVISEAFNGITLGYALHRAIGSPGWRGILITAGRALGGSIVMAAVVIFTHDLLVVHLRLAPKALQIVSVFGSILAGGATYLGFAALMKAPELIFVREALLARRKRAPKAE